MSASSGFTPPLQRRSEQTLERMLDATRAALSQKSFDDLTLQEITERAGVTVGAFYQRFPSKAALLEYLENEAYREIEESTVTLFAAPGPSPAPPVRACLRTFVTGMAAIYREHGSVLRELLQRTRSNKGRQQRRMGMTQVVVGRTVDWILAEGGDIGHPDPHKALSVALLFTSSALRDVMLFEETWVNGGSAGVDELVDELVRAAEAYLGLDGGTQDPRA